MQPQSGFKYFSLTMILLVLSAVSSCGRDQAIPQLDGETKYDLASGRIGAAAWKARNQAVADYSQTTFLRVEPARDLASSRNTASSDYPASLIGLN